MAFGDNSPVYANPVLPLVFHRQRASFPLCSTLGSRMGNSMSTLLAKRLMMPHGDDGSRAIVSDCLFLYVDCLAGRSCPDGGSACDQARIAPRRVSDIHLTQWRMLEQHL